MILKNLLGLKDQEALYLKDSLLHQALMLETNGQLVFMTLEIKVIVAVAGLSLLQNFCQIVIASIQMEI